MKIDEKNDARSVAAQKFQIWLSFPLKSHFFMTEIGCYLPRNIIYFNLSKMVILNKIDILEFIYTVRQHILLGPTF